MLVKEAPETNTLSSTIRWLTNSSAKKSVIFSDLNVKPRVIPFNWLNSHMEVNWSGYNTWWRQQMETFSALLALCAGNSPVSGEFPTHKVQWRGSLMFSLISAWINGWVNNREAGDLRRHRTHYDATVMKTNPSCEVNYRMEGWR